ncbi:MAG TPA: signal recognition particle protein, partial [Gammaproteobacteria bacterium]|nr:signal recognition particle protein [Gammaproteobacteria bacterium]
TEDNIQAALREVRVALLEADVALPVVKSFMARVRERAVGKEVMGALYPGQVLIKYVHQELVSVMGGENDALDLNTRPPAVILMAGLQGAGKTTTTAKLAKRLVERDHKSVMVTSVDVYRPAAIEQLHRIVADLDVEWFPSTTDQQPVEITRLAHQLATERLLDVLIIDTAGRTHIDAEMMAEIQAIHQAVEPVETLFVVDAMTGQDAVNSARSFAEALPLTGVILTKVDGDARGGAALSVREVTGKAIKFLGAGESVDALEPFYPDRVASRILGMGDVLSLVEQAEEKVDHAKAQKLAAKLARGKGFDLEDFREQLLQMQNMGGISGMLDKLPGAANLPKQAAHQMGDSETLKMVVMINSMTPHERRFPALIRGSRKRRIASGSGTRIQDLNRLLKQFAQMQKMMKRMKKKGGMAKMMRGMRGQMPGMPF